MVRIPQEKIDEIRSGANIIGYISRYITLKKTGKNYKGLCPFHKEKTPSFIVSQEKQIFHCFGCGKGGDVFTFIREMERVSYIEAVRHVAFDLGITLPSFREKPESPSDTVLDQLYLINKQAKSFFCEQLSNGQYRIPVTYLKNRKLKQKTSELFELGYVPPKWDALLTDKKMQTFNKEYLIELGLIQKKERGDGYFDKFRNRLMFPFHNISGRIVGFGGRRLDEQDQPKYLNSPESRIYKKGELLYGLFQAIEAVRSYNKLILVEGYFDLLRLVDCGIRNAAASSGTALGEQQGKLIRRYTNSVVIAYDSDDAGQKAALRNSEILESLNINVSIAKLPKPHDPDSLILESGKDAFINILKNAVSPIGYRLENFASGPESSILEIKNKFISETLEYLVSLNDEIKIGLYLHQLSQHLEIAENFLIAQYNKLKKRRRFQPEDSAKAEPAFTGRLLKGKWHAEESMLALLLQDDTEINRTIFDQISSNDFANEDLRDVFEIMCEKWEETGHINLDDLHQPDKENLLSKIALIEIANPDKFMADCIYQMRKWHLEQRFNEVKRSIHEEASSEESVMHYMKELTTIRSKLSKIEKEHTNHQFSKL
jgi:DNA primase